MTQLKGFTDSVLKNAPRFSLDDKFQFRCHAGVPCFNHCCRDVNIFLTPYDVLRLKNALGMSSDDFLDKHTLLPLAKEQPLPTPLLKMEDNEEKSCPFVTPQGCGVYEDRPWACRMYPLGMAAPREAEEGQPIPPLEGQQETFYFVLEEDMCKGHLEEQEWTVREWIENQGVAPYDAMGELYKDLTLHPLMQSGGREGLDPKKMEMFYTTTFDLDNFRRFVFESSFLDRFDIPPATVEAIKDSDDELLKFGFEWLKFALLGKPTIQIRPEAAKEQAQAER